MDEPKFEEVGFLKYSGDDLSEGVIDAGSAGSALTGLDEVIRYFNLKQSPDFAQLEYDIPVQTRAGSWEAVLMAGVVAVGGAFALGYAKKAGEKMAENDFKDIGLKHVLTKSMSALKSLAALIKATRKRSDWKVQRIEPQGPVDWAVVNAADGSEVRLPVEYLNWYQQLPPRLLQKITAGIRHSRRLQIGVRDEAFSDAIILSESDRPLFENLEDEMEDEPILFPEMEHGKDVQLVGRLMRGNAAANSMGLEYEGHSINCHPATGNVRQYKAALFLRCKVTGRVTRHTKHNFVADRRPTIIVDTVIPLESDGQSPLFEQL